MPTYIVLLGPPGAGKGTQAEILAEKFLLPHISSGDIFRENIKKDTDLGKLAQNFIINGELVPDDLTIAMIRERFSRPDCVRGAILDGFPRTPTQADELEKNVEWIWWKGRSCTSHYCSRRCFNTTAGWSMDLSRKWAYFS